MCTGHQGRGQGAKIAGARGKDRGATSDQRARGQRSRSQLEIKGAKIAGNEAS